MPLVRKAPSQYVKEHVRFTTQPMDEPLKKGHLAMALRSVDAGNTLMFSTDYPHYDFDNPSRVLQKFPAEIRRRVACDNAIEWFGLPGERVSDSHERQTA
jgi:predicted TIM-barrel fold metal-dependent hydrolase